AKRPVWCGTLLTNEPVNAAFAAGWRGVTARGRAERAVAGGAGGAHVECADGVINDVLRQVVGDLAPIVEAHLHSFLQIVARHADQADVAEEVGAARLNASRAVEFPATDDSIERRAGIA